MSKLLRYYSPGNTYFLTVVTHRRRPILLEHPELFLDIWRRVKSLLPCDLHAWVVMPDHFHVVISSTRHYPDVLVKRFKLKYVAGYRELTGDQGRLWQHRFWDHIIRHEEDLKGHLDYIHFNPVKHELSHSALAWEWSSFGEFVRRGLYSPEWGDFEQVGPDSDFGDAYEG